MQLDGFKFFGDRAVHLSREWGYVLNWNTDSTRCSQLSFLFQKVALALDDNFLNNFLLGHSVRAAAASQKRKEKKLPAVRAAAASTRARSE